MVNRAFFTTLLLLLLYPVFSQNIEVKIYSNKDAVAVGELFKVSVEATGANRFDFAEKPQFDPSIIQIRSEQFMNVSMVNGSFTSSFTLSFYLKGTAAGDYTLGPFMVKIKNSVYTTNEIKISVSDAGDETGSNGRNGSNSGQTNRAEDTSKYKSSSDVNKNYLLKLDIPKNTFYREEPFVVSVNLYIRAQLQTISYEPLKFPPSAWIEKMEGKDNYKGRTVVGRIEYEQYEIEKKRVYISKEGEYEIPPVVYNFHGLSGSSFFYYSEAMSIKTDPVKIVVKPLPTENKPANFNGAIGDFVYEVDVDPLNLKVKELSTLKIVVSGEGNFHNLKDINYNISGDVDVFSSKNNIETLRDGRKTKKWEILLSPNKPGVQTITVGDFSFFNPKTNGYSTLKGKKITLKVDPSDKEREESRIVRSEEQSKNGLSNDVDISAIKDISYIKTGIGNTSKLLSYDFIIKTVIYSYLILILSITVFIVGKYLIFNKNKNLTEINKKNAYKVFLRNINKLHSRVKSEKQTVLIDNLYKILERYFISKFNIDSVEFTAKGIKDKLSGYLEESQINELKDIILSFDMARFGGFGSEKNDIIDKIAEIKKIIAAVETEKKNES
ncbi:MAG TPA: BatD family protein [Spirochaetota bacterium]|nr:BatD family protein [Spirochaetota bacterium]HOS55549.1 BatD family protein [Spirochaetota bacterium]HQF77526.1 BatD family protein [Spirochaetota bacterium]HQH31400.1 BatD family protein [Spirochaetota bacterium]